MTQIDRAAVAEKFAELGDKRATARALGIHENTVRQILHGLSERCTRCGGAKKTGETYCAKCRSWARQRMARRRQERYRLGLCQLCDSERTPISRQFCAQHRISQLEKEAARRAAKRPVGRPLAGLRATPDRRLAAVRRGYGPEAEALWKEVSGSCQVCGAAHGTCSIQIHHIDENRSNNTRANLSLLCFDCHQATHKLLTVRDREAFLAWFERQYAR